MRFLRKLFAPPEVKAALGALDEAVYKYQTNAFRMVRDVIETSLLGDPDSFVRIIHASRGRTPREWVYSEIANVAGNMLESGEYHIWRGALNPVGPGPDLLRMFHEACDELLQMKAISAEYAKEQKTALRKNMQDVG